MEDVCQSSPEDQVYTNVGVHLDILETSAKPTLMIAYLIRVYEVIVIADVLTLLAVIDRLNANGDLRFSFTGSVAKCHSSFTATIMKLKLHHLRSESFIS